MRSIFLCSTARDLAKYREAVYQAIEGLDGYRCVRVEDFHTRNWMADDSSRARVAECDLAVSIVGHLYGSSPEESERSYTELEYEAAVSAKVPLVVFMAPEEFPVPANLIEPDEKRYKQRAFRERVGGESNFKSFTSPEELVNAVRQAIYDWEHRWSPAERRISIIHTFDDAEWHLPVVHTPNTDNADWLLERLNKLIVSTPTLDGMINAPSYLSALRKEVAILEGSGSDTAIIDLLKDQIKHFCVTAEIYFTNQTSESINSGQFLYSCSSLLDAGIPEYLQDQGWLVLLRSMGQLSRQFGGHFLRVFFIKMKPLTLAEFTALQKVISIHLQNRVAVALMDDDKLPEEVRQKRNIAWIGGKVLIHATDQVQWDLDIVQSKQGIVHAREQHEFFTTKALCVFRPGDERKVPNVLAELFILLDADRKVLSG